MIHATPEHQLELRHDGPEPIVSMDKSLAKLGKDKIIHFDYERYSVMREAIARTLGKDTSGPPGHPVAIEPMGNLYNGEGGEYFNESRRIRLNSLRVKKTSSLQKSFQHEEGHDIDFTHEPAAHDERSSKIGRTASVLWAYTWPAAAPNALLLGSEIATRGNVIETATNPYILYSSLGLAAIYGVRHRLNHSNKRERRARKAERLHLKPVITLTPREKKPT